MTPEVSRICQALFLDRDGVINVDSGYVHRTEDFQFLDGIFDIARDARRLGFEIIVVTNQSGIGRGYYTEDQFFELTRWMLERFAEAGAPLTAVYHCPFHLDARVSKFAIADHPWRKPNPGMLMAAAENHGVSLEHSLLIGDRASDLRAAISAKLAMCCLVGDHMNIPPDLENTALVTVPSVLALSAKFKDLLADLKQP
ncbi:MAG: D-glycero-beta-D-manno-heptose 1,7-bisphosphate 7-phosphatase [Pseudomonadota bacterium]